MVRALAKTVFLALLVLGGSGGLFFYYMHNTTQRALEQAELRNQQLELFNQRLKTDRRVAKILVTDQKTVDGKLRTTLLFVEYARDGTALPAKEFTIDGNEAHFDAEVVKFRDEYVENGDPFRGQSILLFTRVYGADQAPADGFPIDAAGTVPEIYRGADPAQASFEQDLWQNFWKLYNDKAAREARGIRGMNGQGLFGQFAKDHLYTITLRADGDGTITEEPLDPLYQQAMQGK